MQAVIGAENPVPSNGFAGSALYLSASSGLDVVTIPSLKRLTDINGTTILQDLALSDLTTGLSVCTPNYQPPFECTSRSPGHAHRVWHWPEYTTSGFLRISSGSELEIAA